MNPENDRKTPYSDEEIELFVDGFILGLDDHAWLAMKEELGEAKARQKIRAGIIHRDENNLINITLTEPNKPLFNWETDVVTVAEFR